MVSGTEIFSCLTVTDEAILLKRLHEILLILHPGTTPHDDMVCHKSDLSCRERGHTLCTVARSTARNKTLPLTLAHSHSSLIQAAINITQQTQSESNSHTEHCKCQADRSRFCRWGRSPSDVNQIRCRCSWINDLHQWRALTVNILVTDPTPTTPHCIFCLCTTDPSLTCEMRWRWEKKWRMHSVPQVCIPLFLPLVINTTPQNVAGLGLATQQASAPILLFRLEKGGRGCWGKQTEQLL